MTDPQLFASLPTAQFLCDIRRQLPTPAKRLATFSQDAARAPGERAKPIVVIDTNVLLDMLFWEDATTVPLKRALCSDRIWPVRSDDTVDELADVLRRPRFDLAFEKQCELLKLWHTLAIGVTAGDAPHIFCRDPDDVKFLVLAHVLRADYLITKDKKVLRAGRKLKPLGVATITSVDFLQIIGENFANISSFSHI